MLKSKEPRKVPHQKPVLRQDGSKVQLDQYCWCTPSGATRPPAYQMIVARIDVELSHLLMRRH